MPGELRISMTDFAKRIVSLALFAAITVFTFSLWGAPKANAQSLKEFSGSFEKSSQAGDHVAAERTAKRMVDIAAKKYGKQDFNYGLSLNYLALAYDRQNRPANAIPPYEGALKIFEKKLGHSHSSVIGVAENLSNNYAAQGRYDEAVSLAKRVLDTRQKELDPSSAAFGDKLYQFAGLNKSAGRFQDAATYYIQAANIYEVKLDSKQPGLANALHNLGFVYGEMGRYDEAISQLERSLTAYEKSRGPDHPHYAFTLERIAIVYRDQGLYAEAIKKFNQAVAILKKNPGPNDVSYANTINNLANAHKDVDEYAKAISLYKQALGIYDKTLGPDDPIYGNTLNNLAVAYAEQGRDEEAMSLYKRALAVKEKGFGKNHTIVADTLNNMGDLLRNQKKYEQAIPLLTRALKIYETNLGSDHPRVASVVDNLGYVYFRQERYDESIKHHQRALAIREKALGEAHPKVATSVLNLANAHTGKNENEQAIALYNRALVIFEETLGGAHSSIAKVHGNLAEIYRAEKRYDEALSSSRSAMRILTESRLRASAGQDTGDSGDDRLNVIISNFAVIAHEASEQDKSRRAELSEEAFAAAQKNGATSVSAALSQMAARFATDDRALGKTVREQQDLVVRWQELDKVLSSELARPRDQRKPETAAGLQRQRTGVKEKLDEISARLQKDFPQYDELTSPEPLGVSAVQKLLGPDEVLVVYLVQDWNSYAWAITSDAVRWRKLAPETGQNTLSSRVAALRKSLQVETLQGDGELFNLQKAYQLYADLLGPLEDVVGDKGKLLIVPSGVLTSLPFNVLVTEKPANALPSNMIDYSNAAWLIKRHAISILPSVSSLRALREFASKGKAPDAFIGYGDPDFGGGAAGRARGATIKGAPTQDFSSYYTREGLVDVGLLSASLPQLPDTADELRHIAKRLGAQDDQVRLGKVATEGEVKNAKLDVYRVVYFATHGLVAGELENLGSKAAEPALALTVPKKPSELDDGLLTASEIARLKLNADWVVLSACNTAAGDKPGAEALSGLAKAFIYAGARSLLVSHWPVVSSAAVTLTSGTFDAQAKDPSISRSEALRRSMLAMIADTKDPINAYPTIWAPFIVVGD